MKLKEIYFQNILFEGQADKNSLGRAKFIWAVADKPNLNKRIYSREILSAEVERLSGLLANEQDIWGGSAHPEGSANLQRVSDISHKLKKVWMKGNECWAEAEILPTKIGKDLAVVLAHGKVGASLRGTGSVSMQNENELIGADFRCHGIDFVMSPSFEEAQTQGIFESAEFPAEKKEVEIEAEESEEDEIDATFYFENKKRLLQTLISEELGSNVFVRDITDDKIFIMTSDCDEKTGKLKDTYFEVPYRLDESLSEFIVETDKMKIVENENPQIEQRGDMRFGKMSEMEMKITGAKEQFGPKKKLVLSPNEQKYLSPAEAKRYREERFGKK
jgi:hypothetical protein